MLNEKGLAAFLRKSIRRHDVPGASFAVLRNDRIVRRAQAGVVNLDSKIPVTDNAVFQIGSITKPLTATLVMQLVDEGLVGLDAPLVEYLPDFRVARLDVSQTVTIRELLCHTSGIDGDLFVDTGRGDESIRRFMDRCTMVPSLFERGAIAAANKHVCACLRKSSCYLSAEST
jgi:CubicO group peptidase (beta-lactamase class C family)